MLIHISCEPGGLFLNLGSSEGGYSSSTDIPSTTGTVAQGGAKGSSLQFPLDVCHPNIDPPLNSLRLTRLQILLV